MLVFNSSRENYAFFCPLTSKEKLFKPQRSFWKPEVFRIGTSRYSYKLGSNNLDRLRVRRASEFTVVPKLYLPKKVQISREIKTYI